MAEQAERRKLEIKVTFKGEVMFHEKADADTVIEQFRAFLKDHPEILPLTCSGKIHLHPRARLDLENLKAQIKGLHAKGLLSDEEARVKIEEIERAQKEEASA